jgi:hypothetical protein
VQLLVACHAVKMQVRFKSTEDTLLAHFSCMRERTRDSAHDIKALLADTSRHQVESCPKRSGGFSEPTSPPLLGLENFSQIRFSDFICWLISKKKGAPTVSKLLEPK